MKKGNVFAAVIVVIGILIAVLPTWGPQRYALCRMAGAG